MNILKTIIYFSIFKYPITKEEIIAFSAINKRNIDEEIGFLENKGIIFNHNGYYSCCEDHTLVKRRLDGNAQAKKVMPTAIRRGRFIAKFPFVESVCISGALSKNYYDKEGDVDFFIITRKNRLWVARMILTLFRKVFLLNSTKYFCTNYYLSANNLELEEKNRFTATEIATLIPIAGEKNIRELREKNNWIYDFFPNVKLPEINQDSRNYTKRISRLIEGIFSTKFGDNLEEKIMKIHQEKWRKKYSKLSKQEFQLAFKSSKKVSKSHPNNFQSKVLNHLDEKYKEIEERHHIKLTLDHA